MAETTLEATAVVKAPDVSHLVTEDDTPVDNLFSAKQQRLLVEPLYTSWQPGRLFVADAQDSYLEKIGLGLTLWNGVFEAKEAEWLRWCDADGVVLPTGAERAERLAAQLRALDVEPEI